MSNIIQKYHIQGKLEVDSYKSDIYIHNTTLRNKLTNNNCEIFRVGDGFNITSYNMEYYKFIEKSKQGCLWYPAFLIKNKIYEFIFITDDIKLYSLLKLALL